MAMLQRGTRYPVRTGCLSEAFTAVTCTADRSRKNHLNGEFDLPLPRSSDTQWRTTILHSWRISNNIQNIQKHFHAAYIIRNIKNRNIISMDQAEVFQPTACFYYRRLPMALIKLLFLFYILCTYVLIVSYL